MPERNARTRRFQLHRGGGTIAEEASHKGRHHRLTIQLLEFDDGSLSVRFCHYSHSGRFSRSPLMVGEADIECLRQALEDTPRIRYAPDKEAAGRLARGLSVLARNQLTLGSTKEEFGSKRLQTDPVAGQSPRRPIPPLSSKSMSFPYAVFRIWSDIMAEKSSLDRAKFVAQITVNQNEAVRSALFELLDFAERKADEIRPGQAKAGSLHYAIAVGNQNVNLFTFCADGYVNVSFRNFKPAWKLGVPNKPLNLLSPRLSKIPGIAKNIGNFSKMPGFSV